MIEEKKLIDAPGKHIAFCAHQDQPRACFGVLSVSPRRHASRLLSFLARLLPRDFHRRVGATCAPEQNGRQPRPRTAHAHRLGLTQWQCVTLQRVSLHYLHRPETATPRGGHRAATRDASAREGERAVNRAVNRQVDTRRASTRPSLARLSLVLRDGIELVHDALRIGAPGGSGAHALLRHQLAAAAHEQ